MIKVIRRVKPDIVHSHTPKAGLLGTLAARLTGTRGVMLSIFGLPQMTSRGLKLRLLNTMTRFSCRLANRVWCDSHSMRQHLIDSKLWPRGQNRRPRHGSSNGIESQEKFNPSSYSAADRLAVRIENNIRRMRSLLFCRRLSPTKACANWPEPGAFYATSFRTYTC